MSIISYLSSLFGGKVKKVSVSEFETLMKGPNAVVLDVRTEREFVAGHIKDAVNIDFYKLESKLNQLDKNKVYLVYCASGGRSLLVCKLMSKSGFNCYDLKGGIKAWIKEGKPITK